MSLAPESKMPMLRAVLVVVVLLCPGLGRAGEVVDFTVLHKVLATDKQRPAITVSANDDADQVEVRLERDDGKVFKFKAGTLRAGQTRRFKFEVPPGRERHFKGEMSVRVGKDSRTAQFEFDAEIVKPAELTFDKSRVDLAARTMELTSSRRTAKVEVEVTGEQGESLGTTEVAFADVAAGAPLSVGWNQRAGTVLKIAVRVHDPDGFYSGFELYPWRIDIPHEEVNFASGSFALEAAEEPKLLHSLELINDAVARYGRFAAVKLFVAGHTDSVGPADANRALSLNRARSLSTFFRRKGVAVPILYAGFGEDSPKLETADETDEIANRRAEYIIAVEAPPSASASAWKPLR